MNALAKKLLIKPDSNWLLYNAPVNYPDLLQPLPDGAALTFTIEGEFDGIQLFVKNSTELLDHLPVITAILKPDTIFWIIYPKKSSNIPSDLEMMSSWDELEKYGLNGVATAAVDATWTALRFRPIDKTKISATRNEEIQKNEYAQYVDVINKQITLPGDVATLLQENPAAMNFYQSLSYSNRKEYVLWIVTAKQEKTRLDRLTKMIEKLTAGKKNPSEK